MVVFPPADFAARLTRCRDRALLSLSGELDCSSAELANIELEMVGDVHELTIDLRDVTFMDSTGVYFLLRAQRSYPNLRVVRGRDAIHRVLRLVDVERELEFVDEPDPALIRAA
ncbi:MAG TPA: STAS domain-containing protein [Solirubrobacter sp.]|nr:STAS domain-containing protein [Solirubrobacter sp.]